MGAARRGLSEVLGSLVVLIIMLSGLLVYTQLAGRITSEGSRLAESIEASMAGVAVSRVPDGVVVYNPMSRYAEIEYLVVNRSGVIEIVEYEEGLVAPGNATAITDPLDARIVGVILRGGRYFAAVEGGALQDGPSQPPPGAAFDYTTIWFADGADGALAPYVARGARICGLSEVNISSSLFISMGSYLSRGNIVFSVTIYTAAGAVSGLFKCPVTGECSGTITLDGRPLTGVANVTLGDEYGFINLSFTYRAGIETVGTGNVMALLREQGELLVEPRGVGYAPANVTLLHASSVLTDEPDTHLYGDPSYPLYSKPVDVDMNISLRVDYDTRIGFWVYTTVKHYVVLWGLTLYYGQCPDPAGTTGSTASS